MRLVTVLLAVSVALGAVELGLRAFALAPPLEEQFSAYTPDARLPFRPRPMGHTNGRNATNEFDFDYRHSSEGFRDVEHERSKPAGTFGSSAWATVSPTAPA